MRVLPNQVFVAPPRVEITVNGDHFQIAPPSGSRGWPTISMFLRSKAHSAGRRSVAVILSGKHSDGSSALSAIRAAGGTNIAQSDASSPDMPAAAVATGCVDYLLSPAEIADRLLQIAA